MLAPLRPDNGVEHARARALEIHILEREIATLAAQIDAATWRLLELIREFDEKQCWADGGWQSCAHWLNWRVGLGLIAAREHVRVANALKALPEIERALRQGEISYSKVRAITRVATPEIENDLVQMARHSTACEVEKIVRLYRNANRRRENSLAERRHDGRWLTWHYDDDGSFVIRGRLSPEVGAVVATALEAAYRALSDDEREREGAPERATEQERAIDDSAESSVGDGRELATSPAIGGKIAPGCEPREWRARRADALGVVAEAALAGGLGQRAGAERATVTLHIDRDVLANPDLDGRSDVEDGPTVSPDTVRRIGCDASIIEIAHGPDGGVLDVGRRTRSIPTRLRRALQVRDEGCVFPGCSRVRYLEAHHLKHWADGGETSLDNLAQLCWYHHRAVHEGGLTATRHANGEITFRHPGGWIIPGVPEPIPPIGDSVAGLERGNREAGIEIRPDDYPRLMGSSVGGVDYEIAIGGLMGRHAPKHEPAVDDSAESCAMPGQRPAAPSALPATAPSRCPFDGRSLEEMIATLEGDQL